MFKKLRNRFLIINMGAIFIVLLVSFATIYMITYGNVKKEVTRQLDKTLEQKSLLNDTNMDKQEKQDIKQEVEIGNEKFNPPSISFWALLNSSNEILELHNSEFNMVSEEYCQSLLSYVKNTSKNFNYFEVDGRYWAYKVMEVEGNYKIGFVDITNNISVLLNFIYAFLMVAFVVIIVIFLFCYYFANKAIQPIEESFDKQKNFISDASHELRTPLTVINTNIDFVLSNKELSVDSQKKWLQYIKDESIRMSKLTNDLLLLAKVDSLEGTIIFEHIDISQIIETTLLSMEAIIFERGLQLDYQIEPSIMLLGNSDRIKQLCMILLDNSIKYNKKNGQIIVRLSKRNKDAILVVKNTGEMIAKEHLNKLFDRFYRTDASRNSETGGYGIGLSIAQMIVKQHKGKIEAKSNEEEDLTSFIVTIPIK